MASAGVIGLEVLRLLARCAPVGAVSGLGGRLGRRFGRGSKRDDRALANLTLAFPEKSPVGLREIADRMWENFGRTVAESLVLGRIAADPERVEVLQPELLERLQGRAKVYVGLHFGNWECTALPALRLGERMVGLYKESRSAAFERWLHRQRERYYLDGLLPANAQALRTVSKHLQAGGSVCLLGDHRDPKGLDVDFFGHPARSVAFPATLARKYDANLVLARVDRVGSARFALHLEECEVDRSGDRDADLLATTQRIQSVFEQWIRDDPGRWVWFYKRWNAPAA